MEVGKRKRGTGTATATATAVTTTAAAPAESDGEGDTEGEETGSDTRSRLAKRQKIARDRAAAGSSLRDVELSIETDDNMDVGEQNEEAESGSDSLADELERELMGLDGDFADGGGGNSDDGDDGGDGGGGDGDGGDGGGGDGSGRSHDDGNTSTAITS